MRSKSNSRVPDRNEGVAGRTRREKYFPEEGSLIFPPGKSMIFHRKQTEKNELVARPDCYQSSTLGSTERSFASDSFPGKQQQLVSSIGVVEEENTLGSVRGQRRPVSLQIHNQHHQRTIQENDYDSIPARYLALAIYPAGFFLCEIHPITC